MSNQQNDEIREHLYDAANAYVDRVFEVLGPVIERDPEEAEYAIRMLEGRLNKLKENYATN